MEYEQYMHYGKKVWVRKDLKGKHREMCLCHSCRFLDTENPAHNCKVARQLYNICVKYGLTTPVFECPMFEAEQ